MNSLSLAAIFGDNMVVQRHKPVKLWGNCQAEAEISVDFAGHSATTRSKNGSWKLELPASEAATDCTLTVVSSAPNSQSLILKNIAIGEVWIAGGQSNMEFPLKCDAEKTAALQTATNPALRFHVVPRISYHGQLADEPALFAEDGQWRVFSPDSVLDCSAVGYWFAQDIHRQLGVPVGIICCNWGGTTAATWQSADWLENDPELQVYNREYTSATKDLDLTDYLRKFQENRQVFGTPQWKKAGENLLASTLSREEQQEVMRNTDPALFTPLIGPRFENSPGVLFNSMVSPLAGLAVRGVLWYQGESDENRAALYARLFSSMIRCWRAAWEDELPFLFVQLAPFGYWMQATGSNFPAIREQQELVSRTTPQAWMASIMDLGMENDIHPKNKRLVGERLALLARGKVYDLDVHCEAPELSAVMKSPGNIVLEFANTSQLRVKGPAINGLELWIGGKKTTSFAVGLHDNQIYITLLDGQPEHSIEVRFAWQDFVIVNLYGDNNLPAKPFCRIV